MIWALIKTNHQIIKSVSIYSLKKFDFSIYPSFVSKRDEFNKLGSYSWKNSIILSIKNSSNLILWMDSANLIGAKNRNVIKIVYEKGFYSPYSKGTINDWTHIQHFK